MAKTSHPLIFIKRPLTVRGSPSDNSPPFPRDKWTPLPTGKQEEEEEGVEKKNRSLGRVIAFEPRLDIEPTVKTGMEE